MTASATTSSSSSISAYGSPRCAEGHAGRRSGAQVLRRVRQQRDVAGALERDGQLALVLGARAGLAARLDLGALATGSGAGG